MLINHKYLIGLPVETRSGFSLGKIKSFEVDSETQIILKYFIKSRNLVSKLFNEEISELVVHRNQVISIDEKKMVVEDNVIEKVKDKQFLQVIKQNVPALSSTLNILKSHGD